jgi:hypothetical protein
MALFFPVALGACGLIAFVAKATGLMRNRIGTALAAFGPTSFSPGGLRVMVSLVIGGRHQLQIFKAIVALHAVLVVHMLISEKCSTEMLFHYQSVFQSVALGADENVDVTRSLIDMATPGKRAVLGTLNQGGMSHTLAFSGAADHASENPPWLDLHDLTADRAIDFRHGSLSDPTNGNAIVPLGGALLR